MTSIDSSSRHHERALTATRGDRRQPAADESIRRYRRTGDAVWRTRAIETYMPLARKLAHRYYSGGEPLEDLQQVAYLGLVKAVDRFDPQAGTRFASFAVPTITGELRRHFRDTTWSLHVPRGVQEDALRIQQATRELGERLQRAPTVSELGTETGLDAEQLVEALQAKSAKDTTSLESPLSGRDEETTLGDALGRTDDGFDLAEDRTTIEPLLRALPRRDREILFLRFARDMTQSEIGARIGCSQMQVSRLLRKALDHLNEISRSAADDARDI